MKTGIFILSLALLAGCSQPPSETAPISQPQADSAISHEQAVTIAHGANKMEYYRDGEIEVVLTNGQYIVTFPVDKRTKPGTRFRGPDYAAKFWIDSKTGKVLKALCGS